MFVAPTAVIDLWPWALTPLTCRVIGAIFCFGGAGVGAWLDPRWSSVRLMLQVEALMLVLMLIAAVGVRRVDPRTRSRLATPYRRAADADRICVSLGHLRLHPRRLIRAAPDDVRDRRRWSLAGLLTARVLSGLVDEVVVLERERLTDTRSRRGHVPQGRHLHLLLAAGLDRLVDWFPGIDDELEQLGAVWVDGTRAWVYQAGGYRRRYWGVRPSA